jgi:hypothetical protein
VRHEDDVGFMSHDGLGPSYVRLYDRVVEYRRNMYVFQVPARKDCRLEVAARLVTQPNYLVQCRLVNPFLGSIIVDIIQQIPEDKFVRASKKRVDSWVHCYARGDNELVTVWLAVYGDWMAIEKKI